MQFTPYQLSNRIEPVALAPSLIASAAATALFSLIWTGCVWGFVFIPHVPVIRTAVGIASCLAVGAFFSATVGVLLQYGRLRHPRVAVGITAGLAIAGLLLHVSLWQRLFPHIPYGAHKLAGAVLVWLVSLYGGWSALRGEVFCEKCRSWATRKKGVLTIGGDDPALFLEEIHSRRRTRWTEQDEKAANGFPSTSFDLWVCPCGQTCALTATTRKEENVKGRGEVVLRCVAISPDMAVGLQRLQSSGAEKEGDSEPEDEEPTPVYSEARPVLRSWLVIGTLWLMQPMFVLLALVVSGSLVGTLYELWRRTNGLPDARVAGLGLEDFVMTGLILAVGGRTAYRQFELGSRASHDTVHVDLFPERISIRLAKSSPEVEIDLKDVESAQLAEYSPRRERSRLRRDDVERANTLAACLFVTGTRSARGVRLQLRGGEAVCLGLEHPAAFLAVLETTRGTGH
jgi:hypothetical protein